MGKGSDSGRRLRPEETFAGTTSRWGFGDSTTDRIRVTNRLVRREGAYVPAIPPLPIDTPPVEDDGELTVPDHAARLASSQDSALAIDAESALTDGDATRSDTPPFAGLGAPSLESPAAPPEPAPGSVIAERYRVIRLVGEGGMGRVYEVTHVLLGKSFALKLLRANLAADPRTRKSFFREAKFASSLDHPNILSVVDFGEDRRLGAYMVMEFIEGQALSELLQTRGRLSVRRACDVILQLAEALRYIHQHNIVHCDIKTKNILLVQDVSKKRRQSLVKLLDFGLARAMSQKAPDKLFGTPEYLAPELARREPATARSDIYSLGILLFELITGTVPFTGTPREIVNAHIERSVPRPSQALDRHIDPALEKLILTATAKSPEERQKDMAAFLYELKTVMEMLGFPKARGRSSAPSAMAGTTSGDIRAAMIQSTFEHFRLPIAAIDSRGEIVAANAAFSKFIVGMLVKLEGTHIQETLLAGTWDSLAEDLASACEGNSVGRIIEMESNGAMSRLQMWLEPIGFPGVVCFSVYPTG